MISLDTNVLLRYLLKDDQLQAKKAEKLVLGNESVLITDIALVETAWTLSGRKYGLDREAIAAAILALFEEPTIEFESADTVWRALHSYQQCGPVKTRGKKKEADFADALLICKAQHTAACRNQTLHAVYTFDKAAQQIPGARAP